MVIVQILEEGVLAPPNLEFPESIEPQKYLTD